MIPGSVAVIVAAKNAAATIGTAVRSALEQPEVTSVVVVDDESDDNTLEAACRADDGSGRIRAIRLETNVGPAQARNIGIEATQEEEFVAVLDADDFFLPGRIARLLAVGPFDLAADNVAFVAASPSDSDPHLIGAEVARMAPSDPAPRDLTLAAFVEGNITRPKRPRGELGFLKPVIRRRLLGSAPYDPTLRLGEDYALYARLLADGARFRTIRTCGYVALIRGDSLSARHSVADLQRFAAVDELLQTHHRIDPEARALVRRHRTQSLARFEHRRFLEEKKCKGIVVAARALATRPAAWRPVVLGVATDKFGALAPSGPPPFIRFLLPFASPTVSTCTAGGPSE